ncbi:MAG: prepilin-type N-terminal cleavage/methylation domain-containing protein [Smithella sp.]
MLRTISNIRGFTLVEAMIAVFITTIAVVAIFTMNPTSWKAVAKADYMGRAAGVMQSELEMRESQIMSGTIPASPINQTILASGGGNYDGDAAFNVTTTTTNPGTNRWLVNVRVTWPGNCLGGTCNITSSMLITRQSGF